MKIKILYNYFKQILFLFNGLSENENHDAHMIQYHEDQK